MVRHPISILFENKYAGDIEKERNTVYFNKTAGLWASWCIEKELAVDDNKENFRFFVLQRSVEEFLGQQLSDYSIMAQAWKALLAKGK